MPSAARQHVAWPAVRVAAGAEPDPEPRDLAACLAGPNGHDLVVEMAHDLRSPLTAILFLAEVLRDGQAGALSDAQRSKIELIYNAALHLAFTANDVIELARGGRRDLTDGPAAPFSVAEMLTSVRGIILPLAEEKGIEVRLVHPVPERRIGHPCPLSRVLLNLATNAVKFARSGYVEIAARPLAVTRLEFSVRDTGEGIDPAATRSLYQPFRSAPAALHPRFSSAGLGLAICRKLVRAMGSDLRLETRPHWGTRFFFELDLPPAAAAA